MTNNDPNPGIQINIRNCIFGFKCSQKWEALRVTRMANVRFCTECGKDVYKIQDKDALLEAIQLNRCVAIDSPEYSKDLIAPFCTVGGPKGYHETSED